MKCIYCGRDNPDTAQKCNYCKAALIKPKKSSKKKEK